jgi:hypothetical protein
MHIESTGDTLAMDCGDYPGNLEEVEETRQAIKK